MTLSHLSLALVVASSIVIVGCQQNNRDSPTAQSPKPEVKPDQRQTPNKTIKQALEFTINGQPVEGKMDQANAIATDHQGMLKMKLADAELAALKTQGKPLFKVLSFQVLKNNRQGFEPATPEEFTVLLDLDDLDKPLILALHDKAIRALLITRVVDQPTSKDSVRFYVSFPNAVKVTRPFSLTEALALGSIEKPQTKLDNAQQIQVYVKSVADLSQALTPEILKQGVAMRLIAMRLIAEKTVATLSRVNAGLGAPGLETFQQWIAGREALGDQVIGVEVEYNSPLTEQVDDSQWVAFNQAGAARLLACLGKQPQRSRSDEIACGTGFTGEQQQPVVGGGAVEPETQKQTPTEPAQRAEAGRALHALHGLYALGSFNRNARKYAVTQVPVVTQHVTIKAVLHALYTAVDSVKIVRNKGLLVDSDYDLSGGMADDLGVYIRLHSGAALAVAFDQGDVNAVRAAVKGI